MPQEAREGDALVVHKQGWNGRVFDFVSSHYEQVSLIIRTFKGLLLNTWATGIMAVTLVDRTCSVADEHAKKHVSFFHN